MFRKLFHRLRASLRRGKIESELERELRFHLEMETAENMRRGMGEAEARRAAQRSFGGVEQTKETYRDIARFRWIEDFWKDLQFGARMLLKNPGFTVAAVIALALGIGANTAIFSIVNAVVLNPLPFSDSHRLVRITEIYMGDELPGSGDFIHWQTESKSVEHLFTFAPGNIKLTGQGEPERLDCMRVMANLFPALGVAPQLGRVFTQEEDRPGGPPVVVISHAFWQGRFGGDPAIIGQSLTLDGESRLVIGVMPPGFKFIHQADVWLPFALDVQRELVSEMTTGTTIITHDIVGRLKPGFSVEQAQAELDAIVQRLILTNPKRLEVGQHLPPGVHVKMTPLAEKLFGHLWLGVLVLFGAVAFVLLIACANVANLLLVRASARQKEMAIRAALGAGRGRLVRQMLSESLLLSVFGGGAGLLLALLGVKALVAVAPDNLAQIRESRIDGVALGFTFLASLLTGVIAGVIPALQVSRIDLNESLKEGARSAAFSVRARARRISPALVIGELALTLALLAGAGLLIKSFLRLRAVEPGYNPENLLTMQIPIHLAKIPPARLNFIYQDLLARINTLPGVQAAAIGEYLPLVGKPDRDSLLSIVGRTPAPDSQQPRVETNTVSLDYFRTMGMRLRAGRSFTEQDNQNAPPVVVINETLARRHFAGEDPIGKRILDGSRAELTIVGVVDDVKRYGLEAEVKPEVYYSSLQGLGAWEIALAVRVAGDPLNWVPAVRRQVRAIDTNLPIENVMTMEHRLANSVAPRRFQMMLFGAFATVALVLAAVGVYGVISHSVGRRTHEIGIRMALGARARDVLAMVIKQGMSLALAGVVIGLAAAYALTRVMTGLLFNVKATDPATFAGISLLLASVAFLAAYLPARRATKVDPIVALRHE